MKTLYIIQEQLRKNHHDNVTLPSGYYFYIVKSQEADEWSAVVKLRVMEERGSPQCFV